MAKKGDYKAGEHPNSLANLNREGRPKAYGSDKKQRDLSITEEGWTGAQSAVKTAGYASLSDLIEQLGRGHAKITPS